ARRSDHGRSAGRARGGNRKLMSRNLYVTAMEPQSGKSVVTLVLAELLSSRVERLRFFLPVVPAEADPQLELIGARYGASTPYALSGAELIAVVAEHAELARPTVAEVAGALDANVLFDARGTLDREVREIRVAAMSVDHFIDHLVDGTLVIVPGDRPDILLACLASAD